MTVLAIDTSMAACSVAVGGFAQAYAPMERGHAEAIAPMVRDVMTKAGAGFKDLSRIVVTIGPGTFTGVRIGLSMARGLGLALKIPVAGINTLAAIAANESEKSLVVADARKGEVYASLFGAAPAVMSIAECLRMLPHGPITIMGTGAELLMPHGDFIRSRAGDFPVAANFIKANAAATPEPLYLRAPDAKPQQGFILRQVADAATLAALHAECFDEPWDENAWTSLLAMPGASATIAFEAGEPAGFLLLRRAADEAEIITIGTRPTSRRRGVARALIQSQQAPKLFIEVAAANTPARALYAACGFTEAGLRRAYYANGEDAIIMRRGKT